MSWHPSKTGIAVVIAVGVGMGTVAAELDDPIGHLARHEGLRIHRTIWQWQDDADRESDPDIRQLPLARVRDQTHAPRLRCRSTGQGFLAATSGRRSGGSA